MSIAEVKKIEMSLFSTRVSGFVGWEEGLYWRRVQAKLKERVKAGVEGLLGTFLEVGCGKSEFLPLVKSSCTEIIGSDISIEFLKLNHGFQRVLADAENLPFADGSINYLLCIGVIHHVPNKAKMVSEIARVVSENGKVFIMETNSRSLNYLYWLLRKMSIRILGWDRVLSMIGFGTPYESFVSKSLIVKNMKGFKLDVTYYSPFRGLPISIFRKLEWGGIINDFLERIPLIKKLGTYIVFEGVKNDKDNQ